MRMNRKFKSWIAGLVLGMLAFAHASVAIAACSIERGSISQVLSVKSAEPCESGMEMTEFGPLYANRCLAHCTADLRHAGPSAAMVGGVSQAPMLFLPSMALRAGWACCADSAPAATVPKRIQLHSFLV